MKCFLFFSGRFGWKRFLTRSQTVTEKGANIAHWETQTQHIHFLFATDAIKNERNEKKRERAGEGEGRGPRRKTAPTELTTLPSTAALEAQKHKTLILHSLALLVLFAWLTVCFTMCFFHSLSLSLSPFPLLSLSHRIKVREKIRERERRLCSQKAIRSQTM